MKKLLMILSLVVLVAVTGTAGPMLELSASGIAYPEWVKHGFQRAENIWLRNIGDATLSVSQIVGVKESLVLVNWLGLSSTGPLSVQPSESNFVYVFLNAGAIINSPGTVIELRGSVYFLSDSPAPLDSQWYTINIPVADTVVAPILDTIATSCLRLVVSSDGNFGQRGAGRVNMDYWDFGDCDTVDSIPGETDVYLYDGSPIILRKLSNPDTVIASWSIFGDGYPGPRGFVPVMDRQWPIVATGHTSTPTYDMFETGQFVTVDSLVAVELTWYAPKHPDSCEFLIQKMLVFPYKGTSVSGLTIGVAIDWNIPSDTGAHNTSGFVDSLRLMYQRGGEYGQDVSLQCQSNDRRFGGVAFLKNYTDIQHICSPDRALYGAYTALNSDFVEPNGGFLPSELWINMQNPGYSAEPVKSNQHSVMAFRNNYSLAADDSLTLYIALVTLRSGTTANFENRVRKARAWLYSFFGGCLCTACCQGLVGNLDGDPGDLVDISDLAAIVDYLFSGEQVLSACLEENDLDWSYTVDISDLQALIDFLFFGVPLYECNC
ncbi:MAG: hypothetical protein AB1644_03975 [Candidatus Zixiibacteriota bacterium]